MSIVEQIAGRIKDSGISIVAVSKKTGIPYSSLQPTLKGNREMKADELISLCAFLNVSLDELLDKQKTGV